MTLENDDDKATKQHRQDYDDLQAENAGVNNGKRLRFTALDMAPAAKKQREERQWLDVVAFTLQMHRIAARLDELDIATKRALREAEKHTREATQRLEELRSRAALTPDGRRAYLSSDGQAYDESGQKLDDATRNATDFRPDSPTWEQHQDASRRLNDAVKREDEIRRYQEKLGAARSRIEDKDNPLDDSDLADLEKNIEAMPDDVRKQLEGPSRSAASAYTRQGSETTSPFNDAATGTVRRSPDNPHVPTLSASGPEGPNF